jgi:adenylyltransferase/sulfurtransferase
MEFANGFGSGDDVPQIFRELETLKASKSDIENRISVLEAQLRELNKLPTGNGAVLGNITSDDKSSDSSSIFQSISTVDFGHELSPDMIYRYSRHLLLPSFGVEAQAKLLKSSILVIGAGGLGSPALLYLASCGVGRLGIVDHDVVELSNMHRQIIHTEAYIGQPKVKSAAAACRAINSSIQIVKYQEALRTSNALEILSQYDIIVDATDNAPSRYMISDCCVVLGKPLVSGAAIGLEGQLTVYNYNGGLCYRCLFPTPPPATACQRCADAGVLGVVPGIIGCLQALEAIKIASDIGEPLSGRMLLFDAMSGRIRVVKLRGKSLECRACGENGLTKLQFKDFDYEKFTQSPLQPAPLKLNLLPPDSRITTKEYKERILSGEPHILVDVRPAHHFKIVSLPNSLNIPLANLEARLPEIPLALKEQKDGDSGATASVYVVCRRGNDSQRAVQYLQKTGFSSAKDIIGGIESWALDVDPKFPTY